MKSWLAIIFTFLFSFDCLSQTIKGKVIRVADGDTITLLDSTNTQILVSSYSLDCPENGQDFSNVAKQFKSDLCFSKTVKVNIRDIDRYGRTVGIVWTSNSINVNLELLKAGLAWLYKYFDQSEEFLQAEYLARVNKKGL